MTLQRSMSATSRYFLDLLTWLEVDSVLVVWSQTLLELPLRLTFISNHHHHHSMSVTPTQVWEARHPCVRGQASVHASTGLTAGNQIDTSSILKIISLSSNQAVVYPWEFEASFGDHVLSLMFILGNRCWKLETSSAVVEIQPSYV